MINNPSNTAIEHPDRPETCLRHGEFQSRHWKYGRSDGWSGCPTCANEKRVAARARREEERKALELEGLFKRTNIPVRYRHKTFDTFEVKNDDQRVALDIARNYSENFRDHLDAGRCLIFCGTTGTGKTHLACAIVFSLDQRHARTRYVTVMEMIRMIRESWDSNNEDSETEVLKFLCDQHLLVLDEVGIQYGTDAERVQLFDVINARYNAGRPTMIISNLDLEGLRTYLGERVLDRLRENGGRMLVFKGQSWRTTQAQ